jgi:hypothetical protein
MQQFEGKGRPATLAAILLSVRPSDKRASGPTLLRQAKVEQARPYRDRLETADAEIRRHLDRASALINRL